MGFFRVLNLLPIWLLSSGFLYKDCVLNNLIYFLSIYFIDFLFFCVKQEFTKQ